MANPEVKAIISADDKASPVLARIAAQAQRIADEAKRGADSANRAYSTIGSGAAEAAKRNMDRVAKSFTYMHDKVIDPKGGISIATAFIVGAFGKMATDSIRHIDSIITKLDDVEKRMRAFGGATPEQAKRITEAAIKEGANLPGGPEQFQKAAYAGLKANLTPDQAVIAARHGIRFGDMIKVSPDEGTENIIQLASMWGNFKNDKGDVVQPNELTPEQFDQAMTRARARYIREARRLPGKERDLFEFYKMAGPIMNAAGIPEELQQAMALAQAQGGITGSHAGTYARGIVARMLAPSGPARQAWTALGIDPGKYATVDPGKLNPENFQASLKARGIALDADGSAKAKDIIDQWRGGALSFTEASHKLTETIKADGSKSGKKNGTVDDKAAAAAVNAALTPWIKTFDFKGLMEEAREKKISPSATAKAFGLESGTGAGIILQTDIAKDTEELRKERESTDPRKLVAEADKTIDESYGRSKERLKTNLESSVTDSFKGIEGPIKHGLNAAADFLTITREMGPDGRKAKAMEAPITSTAWPFMFYWSNTTAALDFLNGLGGKIKAGVDATGDKLQEGKGNGPTLQERADESKRRIDLPSEEKTRAAEWRASVHKFLAEDLPNWWAGRSLGPQVPGVVAPEGSGGTPSGAAGKDGSPISVDVKGDVQGKADLNIRVEPSPLFTTRMDDLGSRVMRLEGRIGASERNTGTSMQGNNGVSGNRTGAQPNP